MGQHALGEPRKFKRKSDGVVGIGHWILWGGCEQASISWPDGPATRHVEHEFDCGLYEDLGELKLCDDSCIVIADGYATIDGSVIQQLCGTDDKLGETIVPEFTPEFLQSEFNTKVGDESIVSVTGEPDVLPPEKTSDSELPQHWTAPEESKLVEFSRDEIIRHYLSENSDASNAQVVEHLATNSITVTDEQVARVRSMMAESAKLVDKSQPSEELPAA